jgi:hypothetical protein
MFNLFKKIFEYSLLFFQNETFLLITIENIFPSVKLYPWVLNPDFRLDKYEMH